MEKFLSIAKGPGLGPGDSRLTQYIAPAGHDNDGERGYDGGSKGAEPPGFGRSCLFRVDHGGFLALWRLHLVNQLSEDNHGFSLIVRNLTVDGHHRLHGPQEANPVLVGNILGVDRIRRRGSL